MANSPSGDSLISRVVRILETFDTERTSRSVSDIARRTGIPAFAVPSITVEIDADGAFSLYEWSRGAAGQAERDLFAECADDIRIALMTRGVSLTAPQLPLHA